MNNNELTREDQKLMEKCETQLLIGRLREYNSVSLTQQGDVKFFIKLLCDEPKFVMDSNIFNTNGEYYIGFDRYQRSAYLPDFYDFESFDYENKRVEMESYYLDKLIIFQPRFNQSRDSKCFKNVFVMNVRDDNRKQYDFFYSVPKVNMDINKFEQNLKKNEYFDLVGYDGEVNEYPEIILCGSYAYRLKNNGLDKEFVTPYDKDFERWKCVDSKNVVKVDLTNFDSFKTNLIRGDDSIYFIEDSFKNQILLCEDYIELESENLPLTEGINTEKETELDELNELGLENREIVFLRGFQQQTLERGLQYEFSDLINFHTSLKTNSLTILSGMSGTGKTQLAYNYAKMLNLSEDNNTLLFMPISPSYTEPSDILGYLNSMNGLYVPSETGFVKFLQHACENKEQMHMVIFDEMNLSQIEYWFSPFISILEKDPENRYLKLYDKDAHCINEKVYPHQIKIGENILMVGTVNVDETTKDFSDRLLDRTFVINLQKVRFSDFYKETSKQKDTSINIVQSKCESVYEFMKWNKNDPYLYINAFSDNKDELIFLDQLDRIIQKYIPSGGISYRVLRNIANYINNVPRNNTDKMIIDRKEVFDIILNQTVLTKIRGTESQLSMLIGNYNAENNLFTSSELISLLDEYNYISDFLKVRESIRKKAEELKINGYTN